MRKNHEIIGFTPEYDVAAWNERCLAQFVFSDYLVGNDAKEFAAVIHLGFITPKSVWSEISIEIDWIVAYFQSNKVNQLRGGWFDPLSYGMLLCLLAKRSSDLHSICQWATPGKKPEYKGPLPDEVQQLYLVLASQFRERASKGFMSLLEKIQKSRKREVKLLVAALTSVVERDQKSFELSVRKCVEFHRKKPKPSQDAYFMEDWLPIHANTIYLSGIALGLEEPNYDPEISAYLMTPSSVGPR